MTAKKDNSSSDHTQTEEIMEASKEILAKHGIRRTSMNDIAAAVGVSRQTLYSRFDSKEGIVRAVIFYSTDLTIARVKEEWQASNTVADLSLIHI